MPSRGIYNDDFVLLFSEEGDTLISDLNGVVLVLMSKKWTLDLGSIHLELLEGTSSERVSADETNSVASFHIIISKLRTGGCLTRALETNEHDHI